MLFTNNVNCCGQYLKSPLETKSGAKLVTTIVNTRPLISTCGQRTVAVIWSVSIAKLCLTFQLEFTLSWPRWVCH